MKIDELVTKAYEASKAKGWYDGDKRSDEEIAQLVNTEVSEASDAERKRLPPICQFAPIDPPMRTPDMTECWNPAYKTEGEATELGDALIRICDKFGSEGWSLAACLQAGFCWKEAGPQAADMTIDELCAYMATRVEYLSKKKPLEAHLSISVWLTKVGQEVVSTENALAGAASMILAYCGQKGLPLQEAIRHKMIYNETRAYRHGNMKL